MHWKEKAIILSIKNFGENSRIITLFNRSIGKTRGLLKGLKLSIQPGDICEVCWRGRNAEQLGVLKVENLFSPFSFVFNNPMEVLAIESACTLCINGLPDKAPHSELFDSLHSLLLKITQNNWLSDYVLFEKNFLAEMGVGLDLSKCAVTGKKEGLVYVSPRTGKAVIKEVGEKYKNRLFQLPQFLLENSKVIPSLNDIFSALNMLGYFLKMYFEDNKELPLSRNYLIEELMKGIT